MDNNGTLHHYILTIYYTMKMITKELLSKLVHYSYTMSHTHTLINT